jgi:hypothetical protein
MLASSQRDVGIPSVLLRAWAWKALIGTPLVAAKEILTPAHGKRRVRSDSQWLGGLRMTGFDLGPAFGLCEKLQEIDR